MRHTHLLSKLSLAFSMIVMIGVCQTSTAMPGDGAIIFPADLIAEETPASSSADILPIIPMETTVVTIEPDSAMIAPAASQQSDFFAMAWTWMQAYPAWAGFFCVAILMTLVHFGQTMWGVEEMEETQERTDSFMERKPSFSEAMPEVVIPQEEVKEHSYEKSYSSTTEEEPQVTVSQFE